MVFKFTKVVPDGYTAWFTITVTSSMAGAAAKVSASFDSHSVQLGLDQAASLQDADPMTPVVTAAAVTASRNTCRSTIVRAYSSVKQTCPAPSSVSRCELSCPRAWAPGRMTRMGVRGSFARRRRQM